MKRLKLMYGGVAVLSMCWLASGCGKLDVLDSTLVEVRVVGVWTHDDWEKAATWSSPYYPHSVVEITSTKERGRIFGNAIGTTGDVFTVQRRFIREAGK